MSRTNNSNHRKIWISYVSISNRKCIRSGPSSYMLVSSTPNTITNCIWQRKTGQLSILQHGPDKPPPSDGYEFKGKGGGGGKPN